MDRSDDVCVLMNDGDGDGDGESSSTSSHISDLEHCLDILAPKIIFIEKGFENNEQKRKAKELVNKKKIHLIMDKQRIIETINDYKNKSNKDLIEAMDYLTKVFESSKLEIVESSKRLDKIEQAYNLLLKEYDNRIKQ